jgi:hypothetical protein
MIATLFKRVSILLRCVTTGLAFSVVIACAPFSQHEEPLGGWAVLGESAHIQYLGLQEYQGTEQSPSSEEIQDALTRLEALVTLTDSVWNVADTPKIRYFKFASVEDRERLTGYQGNGQAFVEQHIVQSIWLSDSHELAHLLTVPLEVPHLVSFWTEGIAMYYTWPQFSEKTIYQAELGAWWGKTVHYWAQQYLKEETLPALEPLVFGKDNFRNLPEAVGYPVAGSFVTYLLGAGQEDVTKAKHFKEFLQQAVKESSGEGVLAAFESKFGVTLSQVEEEWKTFLETWDETSVE